MYRFGLPALLAGILCCTPAAAGSSDEIWGHECRVEQKLVHGSILISRWFPDSGGVEGGDFVKWNPAGWDPGKPARPLDLGFYFDLPVDGPPAIDLRRIELRLVVGLDMDLPGGLAIHMQRPFPVDPGGILGSSALTTEIYSYSESDAKNGHGELPLGDLLAYAEGYDDLAWKLVRPPDRAGNRALASGRINIAAFREAIGALPEMRKALIAKAAEPEKNCVRLSRLRPPILY